MEKEIKDSERDKKIDELVLKYMCLDDACRQIFFTLVAYKKLGFNDLSRSLRKLGIDMTNPTLIKHLRHLTKQKLVKRRRETQRRISYELPGEVLPLLPGSEEDVKEWLEDFETKSEKLPPYLREVEFDVKEYYKKMPEEELHREIDHELEYTSCMNLHELKTMVNYDLRLDRFESDAVFWRFIGDPLYRMHERVIAENCRDSERYKEKLFQKIDILIDRFRSQNKPINKQ